MSKENNIEAEEVPIRRLFSEDSSYNEEGSNIDRAINSAIEGALSKVDDICHIDQRDLSQIITEAAIEVTLRMRLDHRSKDKKGSSNERIT